MSNTHGYTKQTGDYRAGYAVPGTGTGMNGKGPSLTALIGHWAWWPGHADEPGRARPR